MVKPSSYQVIFRALDTYPNSQMLVCSMHENLSRPTQYDFLPTELTSSLHSQSGRRASAHRIFIVNVDLFNRLSSCCLPPELNSSLHGQGERRVSDHLVYTVIVRSELRYGYKYHGGCACCPRTKNKFNRYPTAPDVRSRPIMDDLSGRRLLSQNAHQCMKTREISHQPKNGGTTTTLRQCERTPKYHATLPCDNRKKKKEYSREGWRLNRNKIDNFKQKPVVYATRGEQ